MANDLTKEQMTVLAKYEDNLRRAYKANYVRNMTSIDVQRIAEVVRDCGYEVDVNASCGACVLSLCQLAGRLYFEHPYKAEKPKPATAKPATKKPQKKVVKK